MRKIYSFFLQKDKQKHMAICLFASLIHPMFALGCAITKEYCDEKTSGNHWCWSDIIADAIGIIAGSCIRYYCVVTLI